MTPRKKATPAAPKAAAKKPTPKPVAAKKAAPKKPAAKAAPAAKPAPAKVAAAKASPAKASARADKKPAKAPVKKAAAAPAPPARKAPAKPKAAPAKKPVAKPAAKAPVAKKAPAKSGRSKADAAADAKLAPPKPSAIAAVRKAAALRGKTVAPATGKASAAKAKPAAEKKRPSRGDILKRLLAMRAQDTRQDARRAAEEAERKSALEAKRMPQSVAKAKELAEARRGTAAPKETAPPPAESKSAAAAKRRRRKAPYSRTELRELRDILMHERDRLVRDLAMINDLALSSEESMSRSFSNHQADAATDSAALETTFMTRRYEEERLSQVLNAIERLEEGTYGLCEMCADENLKLCETCPFIPIGRLRAKPFARLCIPCREKLEKGRMN
ncbi:MAG: TraR/DksA C4-type zinc finger protein [Candidatus Sumerlaeia bacterium]|nr:TraR/DksA C4-type zinc finger protein [Candidatus Sumerlaeia bacterium]